MSEKEQQLNDAKALKKSYIGNAVMLAVTAIGIILAVFAWFVIMVNYSKVTDIVFATKDAYEIHYFTQMGVKQNDEIYYSGDNLNPEDIGEEETVVTPQTLMPGDTIYYRTTIENYEPYDFEGTLALQNMYVNKKLFTKTATNNQSALVFKVTDGTQDDHKLAEGTTEITITTEEDVTTTYKVVNSQTVCTDIDLPAYNSQTDTPGRAVIEWCFVVNPDAFLPTTEAVTVEGGGEEQIHVNLASGEGLLQFNNIRFIPESVH